MAEKGDVQPAPTKNATADNVADLKHAVIRYAPYAGGLSGSIFCVNLMSPNVLSRPFGDHSVAVQNVCFALAHIGTGVYIYHHTPRKGTSCRKMGLFAVTGSVIFNYGTLLLLANIKHYLPQSQVLRCLVGLGVVGGLFWTGTEFFTEVEASQVD